MLSNPLQLGLSKTAKTSFFLAYACPLFFEGRALRVEKMTKHRFTMDFEKAISFLSDSFSCLIGG
jgi:hypothetical protein